MKGNYHLLYRAMAVTEMASWSMNAKISSEYTPLFKVMSFHCIGLNRH